MPTSKFGVIGRFKPLHNQAASFLEKLCEKGDLRIVIGSSNQYDARNPFTPEETKEMIEAYLGERNNVSYAFLPDLGNGNLWAAEAIHALGDSDVLVTNNQYVSGLLAPFYNISSPSEFNGQDDSISASEVRRRMANGLNWEELVPPAVVDYIVKNGLNKRLKNEFRDETNVLYGFGDLTNRSSETEKERIQRSVKC